MIRIRREPRCSETILALSCQLRQQVCILILRGYSLINILLCYIPFKSCWNWHLQGCMLAANILSCVLQQLNYSACASLGNDPRFPLRYQNILFPSKNWCIVYLYLAMLVQSIFCIARELPIFIFMFGGNFFLSSFSYSFWANLAFMIVIIIIYLYFIDVCVRRKRVCLGKTGRGVLKSINAQKPGGMSPIQGKMWQKMVNSKRIMLKSVYIVGLAEDVSIIYFGLF